MLCDTSIVCITVDEYGFGMDSNGWGEEVLIGGLRDFKKVGGLKGVDYPSGDLSAVFAARSAIGILNSYLGNSLERNDLLLRVIESVPIAPDTRITSDILSILIDSINRQIGVMNSTSAGRFLDAVAIVLGISSMNSYDRECPMKLEAFAKPTKKQIKPRFIKSRDGLNLDTSHGLMQVHELKEQCVSEHEIAYAAQWYLGEALAYIACKVAKENQVQHVGFSGGVALNRIITRAVVNHVSRDDLIPLIHRDVPLGDGGISIGQVAVAAGNLIDW
ncbi:MAG: hypothetical protein ACFFE2_06010 [Candidatus Thorarchaeota archaeon]